VLHLIQNVKDQEKITLAKVIPFLEWMIITSCDLACPGCDRFIDFNHPWIESLDQLKENMNKWSTMLQPKRIALIGGEPLLHPQLNDIIVHTRKCFPNSIIEIFTNGIMLNKHPDLAKILQENNPTFISITIHNSSGVIKNRIYNNIKEYIAGKEIDYEVDDATAYKGWYDYRKKINGALKPWNDNDINASYRACGVNAIPIIYKNRLYKCPPISMLKTHATKYNMLNDVDWQPYLNYDGISADCNASQLKEFIDNIFKPHSICGMCPATPVLKIQQDAAVKNKKLG